MPSTAFRIAVLLLLAGFGPLAAQERPDVAAVTALAGSFKLSNADGDRVCDMVLKPEPAAGGFAVAFDRAACAASIGFAVDVAAWSPGPGDAIRLLGAKGRLVAEFTEGVGGTWEALREGDGVYFLTNPSIGDPSEQAQPADLVGLWEVARTPGRTVCRFTLADTPTDNGAFVLKVEPGCEATLARFAPVRWRLERGDLVVASAKGDTLRFAPQEDGVWAKVPEGNRPLLLTRP
ncbi:MAG TPA: AprI/Inh family metalloprotease inhibitor [Xanthobacteraceae bacterium]|nr:AprI/Inh family metalloprotease inhibitor [Xanthobacteraceae bacterium]